MRNAGRVSVGCAEQKEQERLLLIGDLKTWGLSSYLENCVPFTHDFLQYRLHVLRAKSCLTVDVVMLVVGGMLNI